MLPVVLKKSLPFLLGGFLLLITVIGTQLMMWPNTTAVKNNSRSVVTEITLSLYSINGDWQTTRKMGRLDRGDSIVIRHGQNDISVKLDFVINGTKFTFKEPYVDLWTGEGWVLIVNDDGSVDSGHAFAINDQN